MPELRSVLLGLTEGVPPPGIAPCDGKPYYGIWGNPWPVPIYIRKCGIWIGAEADAVIDVGITMTIDSHDPSKRAGPIYPFFHAQDRYAPPAAPQDVMKDFTPDYFTVYPGEWVSIRCQGSVVTHNGLRPEEGGRPLGRPDAHHHPNVTIYFTFENPDSWQQELLEALKR